MGPDVTDPQQTLAAGRRRIEDLRFVVIGAYVVDCFVRVPRLPAWGEELEARSIRTSPGGKALNQAVALSRLGAQVTAVGAVGRDGPAQDVLAALARDGVDVEFIESRPKVATTVCLCFVGDDGESSIVWHIDDDAAVTPRRCGPRHRPCSARMQRSSPSNCQYRPSGRRSVPHTVAARGSSSSPLQCSPITAAPSRCRGAT
jgi:pfkB family carbohydrate kinase